MGLHEIQCSGLGLRGFVLQGKIVDRPFVRMIARRGQGVTCFWPC